MYKNCQRMWEIWANKLLPKALKSCQKSNKSPSLVTVLAWLTSKSLKISFSSNRKKLWSQSCTDRRKELQEVRDLLIGSLGGVGSGVKGPRFGVGGLESGGSFWIWPDLRDSGSGRFGIWEIRDRALSGRFGIWPDLRDSGSGQIWEIRDLAWSGSFMGPLAVWDHSNVVPDIELFTTLYHETNETGNSFL